MVYMVIERFRNGDPVPVYRRFRDAGRQTPDGLEYVSSWVTLDMDRCYQLMSARIAAFSTSGSRAGAISWTSR